MVLLRPVVPCRPVEHPVERPVALQCPAVLRQLVPSQVMLLLQLLQLQHRQGRRPAPAPAPAPPPLPPPLPLPRPLLLTLVLPLVPALVSGGQPGCLLETNNCSGKPITMKAGYVTPKMGHLENGLSTLPWTAVCGSTVRVMVALVAWSSHSLARPLLLHRPMPLIQQAAQVPLHKANDC